MNTGLFVWPQHMAAARNHVASPSYHIYLWPSSINMQPSYNKFAAIAHIHGHRFLLRVALHKGSGLTSYVRPKHTLVRILRSCPVVSNFTTVNLFTQPCANDSAGTNRTLLSHKIMSILCCLLGALRQPSQLAIYVYATSQLATQLPIQHLFCTHHAAFIFAIAIHCSLPF